MRGGADAHRTYNGLRGGGSGPRKLASGPLHGPLTVTWSQIKCHFAGPSYNLGEPLFHFRARDDERLASALVRSRGREARAPGFWW